MHARSPSYFFLEREGRSGLVSSIVFVGFVRRPLRHTFYYTSLLHFHSQRCLFSALAARPTIHLPPLVCNIWSNRLDFGSRTPDKNCVTQPWLVARQEQNQFVQKMFNQKSIIDFMRFFPSFCFPMRRFSRHKGVLVTASGLLQPYGDRINGRRALRNSMKQDISFFIFPHESFFRGMVCAGKRRRNEGSAKNSAHNRRCGVSHIYYIYTYKAPHFLFFSLMF